MNKTESNTTSTTVSLYVKGGEHDAGCYYRFLQYFDRMPVSVRLHTMYSDVIYKKYLPIANNPLFIKVILWLYITVRVFCQVIGDCIKKPAYIVISRRLVSRRMIFVFHPFIHYLYHSGVVFIWDMDDDILASKECDSHAFNLFLKVSRNIILASAYLKGLIPVQYHTKVLLLPSLDYDTENIYSEDVVKKRQETLGQNTNIIWLGTQVSLPYVEKVADLFDKAAKILLKEGRSLTLTVVCDAPLVFDGKSLNVKNIKWSRSIALNELESAHIGIMPFEITEFTKGKGGFKLLQYISMGLPVIATGVGINNDIVDKSFGYLSSGLEDPNWCDAVLEIANSYDNYEIKARCARKHYERNFSCQQNLNIWNQLLFS